MEDEIKEILECLKKEDNYWSKQEHNYAFPDYYSLNREDLHLLLDYITNLQHQISLMKEDIREGKEINSELQQENHELKSKLECYENGAYYSSKVDELEQENERLKQELVKIPRAKMEYDLELEDYKSRCEKAIEYIKQNSQMTDLNIYGIEDVLCFKGNADKLLNILQNGSDE